MHSDPDGNPDKLSGKHVSILRFYDSRHESRRIVGIQPRRTANPSFPTQPKEWNAYLTEHSYGAPVNQ
jgi:hypothetical protein